MTAVQNNSRLLSIKEEKLLDNIIQIGRILKNERYKSIIDFLTTHGAANVTTIFIKLRMEQSVVSQLLNPMRKFGMVNIKRIGKEKHYSINAENLNTYINYFNNVPTIKESHLEAQ